ncbi:hypothetical protein [Mesorhizobium loti]|uniref:hypothetical protein n=1 Tax=Mesorhizobium TaxID=68287 RepID=UPI0026AC86FD
MRPSGGGFRTNIVTDVGRLNLLVRRLLDLARRKSRASGESTSIGAGLALLQAQDRPALRVEAGGATGLRISAENADVLANLIDNSARHGATLVLITGATGTARPLSW